MTAIASLGPLTKTATVPCSPARAFEIFTREMSAWWPLTTHSVGASADCRVDVEPRAGGRIVETLPSGGTAIWGTITVWAPPGRLAFTWHPGNPPDQATEVEVTFADSGSGSGTLVTLVHRGWPARPDGEAARQGYDTGWEYVLGRYRDAVPPAPPNDPTPA